MKFVARFADDNNGTDYPMIVDCSDYYSLSDSVHDFCERRLPCVHLNNLYALNDFVHNADTSIGSFRCEQTKRCRHFAHAN